MTKIVEPEFYEQPDFKNLRLLFLDVDGVINSRKTVLFAGRWPCYWDEHDLKYKKGKHLRYEDAFDKYCVQLVNQVCKATETFIVISSSWRKCYDSFDSVIAMFTEIGIDPKYIIGRTDSINTPKVNRGGQIKRFLEMFQRSEDDRKYLAKNGLLLPQYAVPGNVVVDSYVIVDDMDGEEVFADQQKHLVKTDDYEGLTLRDTLKVGSILTHDIAFGCKDLQQKGSKFVFK